MSKPLSTKPQPPSCADVCDSAQGHEEDQDLLEAVDLLAEHELLALAWISADLVVERVFGPLAGFIEVGRPVGSSVLALFGLDGEIAALSGSSGRTLELANVSMRSGAGETPKLDLTLTALRSRTGYLMRLTKVATRTDIEAELARQVRARMIAEAELVERAAEIARTNDELTRANRDLSEFAHIISHDLNAPLRAMRYIAEDAADAVGRQDTAAALAALDDMRLRSRRMSAMLGGLLAYSQIGRKDEALELVDVQRLVADVVASLERPHGLGLEIICKVPLVRTLAAPLDLVIRNLLDNAIKHHDRETGQLEVAIRYEADNLVIEVRDDGPGIDPRHHAAVFQPFTRLHPERAGAGSGIGLSLVRKTIETVGGTLRLVSDPKVRRGATFEVRWPVVPDAPR